MAREDRIKLHADRARDELDLARTALHPDAARAHLGLSALHLDRLRRLAGPQSLAAAQVRLEPALQIVREI
jgi:hypothetical protein